MHVFFNGYISLFLLKTSFFSIKKDAKNLISRKPIRPPTSELDRIQVIEKCVHDVTEVEESIIIESDSIDYSTVRVPVSLTIFILTSYIMAGGVLFKIIEGWTLLDGVYFSFITVSTIGLGDLVPGNSIINDSESDWKVVGVFCYLLIGLSLIVMGFNLLQETIVSWVSEFAAVLGILDSSDDDASVQQLQFIVSSIE